MADFCFLETLKSVVGSSILYYFSNIRLRIVLSDTDKILDISITENPSSIKFSIFYFQLPFVQCINQRLNTQI